MKSSVRSGMATTMVAAAAIGLTGCGGASTDLTCSDYLAKSNSDRGAIAEQYYKDATGSGNVGTFKRLATEFALTAYCRAHPDQVVKDITLG